MVKVTCIVDNTVGGLRLWGEHGLSFLVETGGKRLLFDTGQSGTVLQHNLETARVDAGRVDAIAVSHAHFDHTGGLDTLLQHAGSVPLFGHTDLFRGRFSEHKGKLESVGLPIDREQLKRRAELRLSDGPQEILPGVYTTGEIVSRSEPEGRSPRHFVKEGTETRSDPYRDDMAIVLQSGRNLTVLCGCCHAGLLNTLQQVRAAFEGEITAVAGGLHLGDMNEQQMQHIIDVLSTYGPPKLYPNHCTGQRAYVALSKAFGDLVAPCPVGTELTF